eukprot:TRINITY_DN56751_c0_g1_i1.p1 TRINITY_DN56751_c0_g1~~TRINITY_DN56751_c0_g1_i1.p1  ORF type:complete len:225 (+),score=29.22 TRINITY_DN56751_c0_g1_i1:54-677(+)
MGKQRFFPKHTYADGCLRCHLTKGWLHGFACLAHTVRFLAGPHGWVLHLVLALQYAASFVLHNVHLSPRGEALVVFLDNICIAFHIAVLGEAGGGQRGYGLLAAILAATLGFFTERGVESWRFKFSLIGVFIVAMLQWYMQGFLANTKVLGIPCLYCVAFYLYGHYKAQQDLDAKSVESMSMVFMYDAFHFLQVMASLSVLYLTDTL